jgi:myo-inositol-1(or 4)-monophosphatase
VASEIAAGEARDRAEEWARGAGAVLREYAGRAIEVDYKGVQDLVTSADRASEAYLVEAIRRRYPDHAVLAEEGTGREAPAGYRWLVDPLDGTTNFAHRYPFYAVSLALERAEPGREGAPGRRGPIVAAAVYDPVRDECWTAARGEGAKLDGRPIHVSDVRTLERALAATGFPYDFKERPAESLPFFEAFLYETQAVRRDGSAALNLCYLACGRFDAFWEIKLHAWDTAAACLVIEEAGGRVTDFAGGAFDPFGIECAASNGLLHGELLGVLARFPRPRA